MHRTRQRQRGSILFGLSALISLALYPPAFGQGGEAESIRRPTGMVERRLGGFVPHELVVKLAALDDCDGCAMSPESLLAEASAILQPLAPRAVHPLFTTREAPAARMQLGLAERKRRAPAGLRSAHIDRILVVTLEGNQSVAQAVADLAADPRVEYAERIGFARAQWVPSDPFLASTGSWGQSYPDLWGLHRIGVEGAWDVSRGQTSDGRRIVVAVVDTGVDGTHPDLAGNLWINPGEIPDNGIDDDGNGFVDDVGGWDFSTCESFPGCTCTEPKAGDAGVEDTSGHGTHVAGIIAAVADNGIGIAGVAPRALVMPVRALNRFGYGSWTELAQAIRYAADNGADVLNASWGGPGSSLLLDDAMTYAQSQGVIVVAAAGNERGVDALRVTPSGIAGVITVAAANPADDPEDFSTDFSCRGAKLDVAAPGVEVLSLRAAGTDIYGDGQHVVSDEYYRASGTSMAAPHVAGAIALLLAAEPGLTADQVRQIVRSSAADTGAPGFDLLNGYGRLDVAAALATPVPPSARIASPLMRAEYWNVARIPVRGTAAGPGFSSFRLQSRQEGSTAWSLVRPVATTAIVDGNLGSWQLAGLPDAVYHLQLQVNGAAPAHDLAEVVVRHDKALKSGWPRQVDEVLSESGPAFGDIDHDGKDEIVLGTLSAVSAYRADGTLLWRRAYDGYVSSPALADLDGNGKQEIVFESLECSGAILRVLDATGAPVWTRTVPRTTGTVTFAPIAVSIGDVDGDGKLEILVPHPNDKLFVYSGSGVLKQQFAVRADGGAVAIADLDGSGRNSILIAATQPQGGRWVHRLQFDKQQKRLREVAGWPVAVEAPSDPYGQGLSFSGPIAVDLDGDRKLEVAMPTRGKLSVLRANGKAFPGWPRKLLQVDDLGPLSAGDLDGDGRPEIIEGTQRSGLYIFRRDGSSQVFQPEFGDAFTAQAAVADLDGDGRAEAILQATSFRIPAHPDGLGRLYAIRYKPATRRYEPLWTRRIADVTSFEDILFTTPLIGDFDRNGKFDLFVPSPFYAGTELVAYELGASTGRKVSWSMLGHDARRTNRF